MVTLPVSMLLARWTPTQLQALFSQSPAHAAAGVRVLALEGLPQAQVCFGRMLLEGTGIAADPTAAFAWFLRAAAQGDRDGLNMVGRCYENGWGTSADFSQAVQYYGQAAKAGDAWAQYNLGHLYLDGLGVEQDLFKAYSCYLASAEQGHPRAMNLLGRCAEEGWGTSRNLAAAAGWYQRSAEGGYFRGQYNWASWLLRRGREDEAANWFERAALGGTAAVREAVVTLISSCSRSGALAELTRRLGADVDAPDS
jgi:uncharacterized protein